MDAPFRPADPGDPALHLIDWSTLPRVARNRQDKMRRESAPFLSSGSPRAARMQRRNRVQSERMRICSAGHDQPPVATDKGFGHPAEADRSGEEVFRHLFRDRQPSPGRQAWFLPPTYQAACAAERARLDVAPDHDPADCSRQAPGAGDAGHSLRRVVEKPTPASCQRSPSAVAGPADPAAPPYAGRPADVAWTDSSPGWPAAVHPPASLPVFALSPSGDKRSQTRRLAYPPEVRLHRSMFG